MPRKAIDEMKAQHLWNAPSHMTRGLAHAECGFGQRPIMRSRGAYPLWGFGATPQGL